MKVLFEDKEVVTTNYLTLKELARMIGVEYYLVYSFKNKRLEIKRRI